MKPIDSEAGDLLSPADDQTQGSPGAPTPAAEARFCLARLQRLLERRSALRDEGGPEADLRRRLLARSIYSFYRDCEAAGAGQEALVILRNSAGGA